MPCLCEKQAVTNQVGRTEFRETPLPDAEKFAGASNPEVLLRNDEPIGGPDQGLQPLSRRREGGPRT